MSNRKQAGSNSTHMLCPMYLYLQCRKALFSGRLATLFTAALFVSACNDSVEVPVLPDESNSRAVIINNLETLNQRVVYTEENVVVEDETGAPLNLVLPPALNLPAGAKSSNTFASLTLLSEILPPVVEGETIQATAVSLSIQGEATISYNMRGAPRLGGIDYINRFNVARPRLTSGITFNDSDVNAVATDGAYVYTAVATEDPAFASPAVMERMRIKFNSLTLEDNDRYPLSSFAATSVLPTQQVVYATSGNEGHVFAFDSRDHSLLGQFPLHDARWVERDSDNNRIIVVQGTPGMISVFEEGAFPGGSMNLLNSFPFDGANVAESKSTVDVAGGKAFIAAGPDGVQVMCLDDGSIIGSVPIPDPVQLGLDPSVVVTNAVSVDGTLMFISNGEAGVYVAEAASSFGTNNCNLPTITVLGKLRFDDLQSANHVDYKSGYLYVAAGLGGIKVVRVDFR